MSSADDGRSALRSPAGWRAFDRASLAVALLLALGLLAWALSRPASEPASGQGMASDSPPVRMKVTEQRLAMQVLGGRLLLSGEVADEAEREALTRSAEAAFGAGAVSNQLKVRAGAEPLAWRDHATDIFKVLNATHGDAAITLAGRRVKLEGEVAADYAKLAREVLARQWFGRQVVVDNQLRVAAAPALASGTATPAAVAGATSATRPAMSSAAPTPTTAAPATAVAAAPSPASGALPAACAAWSQGVAVRFHPNAPGLTDEGRRALRELLPCLAQGRWQVGNHTDANGDPDANQRLTQARAESVVAWLVGKGVAADRLQAKGFAATRPMAGNDTPEDRLRNRRVTVEPAP